MTDQVILTQTERVLGQGSAGTIVQRIDSGTVVVTGLLGPAGSPGLQGPQGPQGPPGTSGITSINDASDINTSGLQDGSLLIYEAGTTKWVATRDLTKQTIDGGSYQTLITFLFRMLNAYTIKA